MTFIPPQNKVCFVAASADAFDFVVASAYTNSVTPEQANVTSGKVYTYYAQNPDGSQWESGSGIYDAVAHTLKRTTITANSDDTLLAVTFTLPPVVMVFGSSSAVLEPDFVKYDSSQALTAPQQLQARSNVGFGASSNCFRNGMFEFWQRFQGSPGPFSGFTPGLYAYTADGWMANFSGAGGTETQVSNPRAGGLCFLALKLTGATSCTNLALKQRIESIFMPWINGQIVTVQAQVTNNTGGTITPVLSVNRGATLDSWASTTVELAATNLQACPNGVTTMVAYTFTLTASSVTNGIEVIFDFGNNFSSNAKSVTFSEAALQVTPNLAVGLCTLPPVIDRRTYQDELILNYRYLSLYSGVDWAGNGGAGQAQLINWAFPTPMRVIPTMQISGSLTLSNCTFASPGAAGTGIFSFYVEIIISLAGGFQIIAANGTGFFAAFAEL